jgi:hypothetical protein
MVQTTLNQATSIGKGLSEISEDGKAIEEVKLSLIMDLISPQYQEKWYQAQLARQFQRHDYIKLPNLFTPTAFAVLKEELDELEKFSKQRDFVMRGYETPRIMNVLGGAQLLRDSEVLWTLYGNHQLLGLLENIIGGEVYPCRHPNEFMVANFLLAPGSTHGWHLDDPAYALITVLDAPPTADGGGLVEFIPNWRKFAEANNAAAEENVEALVELARQQNLIQQKHHAAGDAYLLRADECLHRVTPLNVEGVRRAVLNLGLEATPNPTYGFTASELYGTGHD